jgi:hypothetical protein
VFLRLGREIQKMLLGQSPTFREQLRVPLLINALQVAAVGVAGTIVDGELANKVIAMSD